MLSKKRAINLWDINFHLNKPYGRTHSVTLQWDPLFISLCYQGTPNWKIMQNLICFVKTLYAPTNFSRFFRALRAKTWALYNCLADIHPNRTSNLFNHSTFQHLMLLHRKFQLNWRYKLLLETSSVVKCIMHICIM